MLFSRIEIELNKMGNAANYIVRPVLTYFTSSFTRAKNKCS